MDTTPATASRRDRLRTAATACALVVGLIATGMLSTDRVFHVGLPGCGEGSGCAAAAESQFARIHRLPVAHLGFAYAFAMAAGWLAARCRVQFPLVWGSRFGAVVSSVYVVLIVEHGYHCGYCTAAHAANLTLWFLFERSRRFPGWRAAVAAMILSFGLVLAAIAIAKPMVDRRAWEERQRNEEATINQIVADAGEGRPKVWLPVAEPNDGIRIGASDAPIRVTVFLDYQCGYCRVVAREIGEVARLPGVAVTWRQLPHGWPCNPRLKANIHDCACRAARVSVACAGTPDFARIHTWLLEREGRIQEEDVEDTIPKLVPNDAEGFWRRYHSVDTRQRVQADLELAERLGLHGTPAVFINGMPLESPNVAGAVRQIAGRLPAKP